ncbi:MAG: response regulator [Alphaproteobacteria bacterium]|nr:response regulator [Alphaproteobacteria bacterium]
MGRVLIVDDNAANRRVLEAFCEAFGLTVEQAGSGARALDILRRGPQDGANLEEPFGIILMDVHMPDRDGVSVAREILARRLSDAPIVAVTADTTEETKRRCLESGMVEVVHKPVRVGTVAPVLCRYFEF